MRASHPDAPPGAGDRKLRARGELAGLVRAVSSLLGSLLLAACGEPEPPPPSPAPPPGAVLRVGPGKLGGEPGWITEQEVDRWVPTIELIEPRETLDSHRRKALTNIVLPTRVAALLVPADCERTRALVHGAHANLVAGLDPPPEGPQVERVEGGWKELGLDCWGVARETPPGRWSEVFETIAGFGAVRLVEGPAPDQWKPNTRVVIERVAAWFLRPEDGPHALIEDARRQLGVVPLDPEWEWILPKLYQYE